MSIEDQNLQIVKDAYASSARGEAQGFTASFTAETEIHEAASLPYGGIYKGVESFPTLIRKVLEFFSSLKFTKHHIIASGENVISWGVLDLTGKLTSTTTAYQIGSAAGSVLEVASSAAAGTTFTFAGPTGTLELANVANGVVQQFNGTIQAWVSATRSTFRPR